MNDTGQRLVEDASVYSQMDEITHVLHRPEIYAANNNHVERKEMVYNGESIKFQNVTLPACLVHIYKEVLGNVTDNIQRSREYKVDPKVVEIFMTRTSVTVRNYGTTIPIEKDKNNVWLPEGLFGQLRYSQNFDDNIERTSIGKNGMGVKLTNIFSNMFIVKVRDKMRGILYTQVWRDHMRICELPSITEDVGDGYVEVTYYPDLEYFKMTELDDVTVGVHAAYAAMIAFSSNREGYKSIPVIFNNITFDIPNIKKYVSFFYKSKVNNMITIVKDKYQICIIDTPNEAINLSFVNCMNTSEGGVHVEEVFKIVRDAVKNILEKAIAGIRFTKSDVEKHISIILSCTLDKPKYKTQSKDYLTSPTPKFEIPAETLSKISKWDLVKVVHEDVMSKQLNKLSKTDGNRKQKRIYDKENLFESNWAGKANKAKTTLIIFEGKSAKGYSDFLMDCIPNGQGKDLFGRLCLHGKLLNILNADFDKLYKNRDISLIKSALGLQEKIDYYQLTDIAHLRYGSVLLAPDADNDGIHIAGLLLVFFCIKFPGLVYHGKIFLLRTPVVRATHKKTGEYKEFLNEAMFILWAESNDTSKWEIKYYKGLGTSELEDVKKDVENPHYIRFQLDEEGIRKIAMAFHQKIPHEERKKWFYNWMKEEVLDMGTIKELPVATFVDKELPLYVVESIYRAIPDVFDGLKESQRKIIFAATKELKTLKSKMKVAELADYVSHITCYKHGSKALCDAVVHMGLHFIGTNNMPYLVGHGSFGSNDSGIGGVAQPRYVSVSLSWWLSYVYKKEDNILLTHVEDEGKKREYERYYPILPIHLINRVIGIGKVVSTKIPSHNPQNICIWLQQKIKQYLEPEGNHQLPSIVPWYKGFYGSIVMHKDKYVTYGSFYVQGKDVIITGLPVGKTVVSYLADTVKKMMDEEIISDYDDKGDTTTPRLILKNYKGNPSHQELKLITRDSYSNMTVIYPNFDETVNHMAKFTIKYYKTVTELMEEFFSLRRIIYHSRKSKQLEKMYEELKYLRSKRRFVQLVNDNELIISNRVEAELEEEMVKLDLPTVLLDNIKSRSFNLQGIKRIDKDIDDLMRNIEELKQTVPEVIWFTEIEDFIKQYCSHNKEPRKSLNDYPPLLNNIYIYGNPPANDKIVAKILAGESFDEDVDGLDDVRDKEIAEQSRVVEEVVEAVENIDVNDSL